MANLIAKRSSASSCASTGWCSAHAAERRLLFEVLCRGEFLIHGFRNRSLRQHLKQFRPLQVSRSNVCDCTASSRRSATTCKYYLTELGRHVAIAGLTLKNMFLVPEFARAAIAY